MQKKNFSQQLILPSIQSLRHRPERDRNLKLRSNISTVRLKRSFKSDALIMVYAPHLAAALVCQGSDWASRRSGAEGEVYRTTTRQIAVRGCSRVLSVDDRLVISSNSNGGLLYRLLQPFVTVFSIVVIWEVAQHRNSAARQPIQFILLMFCYNITKRAKRDKFVTSNIRNYD